jgi:D-alanyl-D-alanine carboxypeptidase (penicillin-binding protein 5/6)
MFRIRKYPVWLFLLVCTVFLLPCTVCAGQLCSRGYEPESGQSVQTRQIAAAWSRFPAQAQDTQISTDESRIEAPSGVLIEAETGTLLYAKDKDTRRSPASITKIMTLILIFDAIDEGRLNLDDVVTTSAYAKSMGGSQVYLEEGEQQSVETLIKCIVVASGNDASVAMAEHISGSEEAFVEQMNARAQGLGMENTHFEDCCGLTESENHYTTAYDIALMSRELLTKYPQITDYSTIWMENIIHTTRQGSSEFGLTNTNKLLRSYDGCIGLKTGSTSLAKYCFSGAAKRNGITLIAVVMAAPDYKARFSDAASLLDYGFSRCSLYQEETPPELPDISVKFGKEDSVALTMEESFTYLRTDGQPVTDVETEFFLEDEAAAPVKKGDTAGELCYYMDGKEIGRVKLLYAEDVERATYFDCIQEAFGELFSV